jgi:gluconolactonase
VKDPLHLTFASVKAGSYLPGNTGPDGIYYDVHGNLWVGCAALGEYWRSIHVV